MRNLTFIENTAEIGGALSVMTSIDNSQQLSFVRCTATVLGGAVAVKNGARFVTDDSKFELNNATERGGGMLISVLRLMTAEQYTAISVEQGTLNTLYCMFSGNVAGMGGAIAVIASVNAITCDNTSFVRNEARSNGGGVYFLCVAICCVAIVCMADHTCQVCTLL